jgi:DNA primase
MALPAGFEVRLLVLPPAEDPDTWCRQLGAEAFKQMIQKAPDWTEFVIGRSLEGRDLRRISDRMEVLRALAEFLIYLPHRPERRELFASLAHQLQIPLTELERAVRARTPKQETRDQAPAPSFAPTGIDELLRPLILLARDPIFLDQVRELPPTWWESLSGAPLLQALLDAEGQEEELPEQALAEIRHIEAARSRWDAGTAASVFLNLERSFLEREQQAVNRQIQDPTTGSDPQVLRRLELRQMELLRRKTEILQQLRRPRATP